MHRCTVEADTVPLGRAYRSNTVLAATANGCGVTDFRQSLGKCGHAGAECVKQSSAACQAGAWGARGLLGSKRSGCYQCRYFWDTASVLGRIQRNRETDTGHSEPLCGGSGNASAACQQATPAKTPHFLTIELETRFQSQFWWCWARLRVEVNSDFALYGKMRLRHG